MQTQLLKLKGLVLIKPEIFLDQRGFFLESWSASRYSELGITTQFVQDNHSSSSKSTLRGLHYQAGPGQAKLVRVICGKILDVAVDIRPESETFGEWISVELDAKEHCQLYIPEGFAHGFAVLSDVAEVLYKVSTPYVASLEKTISWNDPDLSIDWKVENPILSKRDQNGESFKSFSKSLK